MELSVRIAASQDVVSREVGGEMVLLDLSSGQYFGLHAVGGRIWSIISNQPMTIGEMCDQIEAEFDAPREQIELDIVELVGDLSDRGLVILQ